MPNFTDTDLMPFGKHKGVAMANVPAAYLIWLRDELNHTAPNKRTLNQKLIIGYVEDNMDVLEREVKG